MVSNIAAQNLNPSNNFQINYNQNNLQNMQNNAYELQNNLSTLSPQYSQAIGALALGSIEAQKTAVIENNAKQILENSIKIKQNIDTLNQNSLNTLDTVNKLLEEGKNNNYLDVIQNGVLARSFEKEQVKDGSEKIIMKEYDSTGKNVIRKTELFEDGYIKTEEAKGGDTFDVITRYNPTAGVNFRREKRLIDGTKLVSDSYSQYDKGSYGYSRNIVEKPDETNFVEEQYEFSDDKLLSFYKNTSNDKITTQTQEEYYFMDNTLYDYKKNVRFSSSEEEYYVMKNGKLTREN